MLQVVLAGMVVMHDKSVHDAILRALIKAWPGMSEQFEISNLAVQKAMENCWSVMQLLLYLLKRKMTLK